MSVQWATEDCFSFGSPVLRKCDAYAAAITGGDAGTTLIAAACLFSSPNLTESGLEDIENALLETREVDADVEKNCSDEYFVTYELTVHEESGRYTQPSRIAALTLQVRSRAA